MTSSPNAPFSPENVAIGEELRMRRAGCTPKLRGKDVYERAGISKSAYMKYESGEVALRVPTLIRIATALGTTAEDIISRAVARNPEAFHPGTSSGPAPSDGERSA